MHSTVFKAFRLSVHFTVPSAGAARSIHTEGELTTGVFTSKALWLSVQSMVSSAGVIRLLHSAKERTKRSSTSLVGGEKGREEPSQEVHQIGVDYLSPGICVSYGCDEAFNNFYLRRSKVFPKNAPQDILKSRVIHIADCARTSLRVC